MIEALVAYIEDRIVLLGYCVMVREGMIVIEKYVGGCLLRLDWRISRYDLEYGMLEALKVVADRKIEELLQVEGTGSWYTSYN